MRRRELLLVLATGMMGTRAVRAQQKTMPVIGFLGCTSPDLYGPVVAAFHQGLTETGYVESKNLAVEYRWALGDYDRLSGLAADLVRRNVEVIATVGNPAAVAAKSATSTIPIVFGIGGDPVELGFVTQSRSAERQPHGRHHHQCGADTQAVRANFRAGSLGPCDRPARQPEQSGERTYHSRFAGSGAYQGARSRDPEGRHRKRISRPPWRRSPSSNLGCSSSAATSSSLVGAISWCRWPHVMAFRRSISGASSRRQAA